MTTPSSTTQRPKVSIVDKPFPKPKGEVNLSTYAFLLSEIVQYAQKRITSAADFQRKLADYGRHVGIRLLDLTFLREKRDKREVKFLDQLNFIKKYIWKSIYNKEMDSIERHATDPSIYYMIEKDPIINKFISRDCVDFNLAYFNAGIIDVILNESNFPCKVELVIAENCVYYSIMFDKIVISREKTLDTK